MPDKLAMQGGSDNTNDRLFSESNTVPLPDDYEHINPWGEPGGPGEQKTEESGPSSPPEPSRQEESPPPPRPHSQSLAVEDVQPPMYSGPSQPQRSSSHTQPLSSLIPGLPPISFSAYAPLGCTQSRDLTSIRITNPPWASSLDTFTKAIYEQIALPPRTEVRILGNLPDWPHASQRDAFDIRINMMRYFLPRDGNSGLSYVKARQLRPPSRAGPSAASEVGLQETVQAFFADPVRPKSLTITRMSSNWDTDFIVGRVHALTASLNYEHRVKVEFPKSYTRFTVTIQDEGTRSFASSILAAFKASKEYAVDVVWPYATAARGDEEDTTVERKCLIRSEEGWWSDWRGVVREAVRTNRVGWVGLDDWMDMAMRPRPQTPGISG